MEETFGKTVRRQLQTVEVRKKCCRFCADAIAAWVEGPGDADELRRIWAKCRCDGCRGAVLRTLFLTCGTVTDPAKSYQLDLTFADPKAADAVREIAGECGFALGESTRRGKTVLYLRDSEGVEDFLAAIGATAASFAVINAKILSEFRGNVNRQVNFDTANIEKQLRAVKKVADAAERLKEAGLYDRLAPEIRRTVELRLANEQLTFEDLGKLHDPPISKSGVKHRLDRILKAAQEIDET